MEENKNNCGKCNFCAGMNNHCSFMKCHLMRKLVWIILLFVVFCFGVQLGELKSEARGGNRFNREGMMNWNYKNIQSPMVQDLENNVTPLVIPVVTQ